MIRKKVNFATAYCLLLALLLFSSMVHANAVYSPSSWSSQKIAISAAAGITPENFDAKPFTNSITRLDFCELLINACRTFGTKIPASLASHPFTDTTDSNAETAYLLGLTNGTDKGIFSPDGPLTREMAAVMLSRMRMLFQFENPEIKAFRKISKGTVSVSPARSSYPMRSRWTKQQAEHKRF